MEVAEKETDVQVSIMGTKFKMGVQEHFLSTSVGETTKTSGFLASCVTLCSLDGSILLNFSISVQVTHMILLTMLVSAPWVEPLAVCTPIGPLDNFGMSL